MLRTKFIITVPFPECSGSRRSLTWIKPMTSSLLPRTTGYRECAFSTAIRIASLTSKLASRKSTSVLGTITSCTKRSLALKTSSTISRSSSVSALWPVTRSTSSSSEISSRDALGSIPNNFKTKSDECESNQIKGRNKRAVIDTGVTTKSAIFSLE